jgi:CheY-like chemotaxis protein
MKTLFYCDDDLEDIFFFRRVIEKIETGLGLVTFENAEEGIQYLQTSDRPDYIFLDFKMPKINGLEFVTLIKKNPKLEHIPIIIFTHDISELQLRHFNNLGVFLFISKSDMEDLEKSIRNILQLQFYV